MLERIYTGPHAEVEVALPDGSIITVANGNTGTFPDEVASALDEQPTNWKPAKTKAATGGKE